MVPSDLFMITFIQFGSIDPLTAAALSFFYSASLFTCCATLYFYSDLTFLVTSYFGDEGLTQWSLKVSLTAAVTNDHFHY